jgi:hypothetical protein
MFWERSQRAEIRRFLLEAKQQQVVRGRHTARELAADSAYASADS